ncbi:MFS transporter [Neisseria zalophi]|uniref:MFS transporter n=1 Tax=Neisseria zalophi TaxID=640030 RepID=A0A5J6PWL3_9NEIS|nr:MFS transporter [Neisseria zalophi]QEY26654.1 MFS transporter [Neisseria zalophi]
MTENTSQNKNVGSFAPLRQKLFLVLWIATIMGNTGSFIRDVASSWLMTDLSPSPAAVAMVQAAATLPIFLLAIPAGVLSDILDRRKFLIGIQLLLAGVSVSLMLLSASGMQSVTSLILFTFLGGIGAALMGPTWQAIVPELVDRKDLKGAVALNSLGINIARAIGPALGGLILAGAGAAFAYGADVLSYVFVISALLWWKRPKVERDELSEQFGGAFRAGLRYVRASRELHIVLFRTFIFFAIVSSGWSLLPLIAKELLNGGAGFYGIVLGAIGVGAIIGAVIMPHIRRRLDSDGLMVASAVIVSLTMVVFAVYPPQWVGIVASLALGVAWITALTTLNSVAQSILPNWVRGRSLAVYLTVFNGAMTIGSLVWGSVASFIGISMTLIVGAVLLIVVALMAHRVKLPKGEDDLSPSNHWDIPLTVTPVAHDRGPVLVQIEYRIDPEEREAFLETIKMLSAERRRDGAYQWGVSEDTSDTSLMLEWFLVESWAEHMRQHHRVSKSDADIQEAVKRFHRGDTPPKVRHFVSCGKR